MTRPRRIGYAALASSIIATTLLTLPARAAAVAPSGFARGVSSAAAYGAAHGMRSGVAVLDTRTGRVWAAGVPYQNFVSASVIKTMIATRLLLTGQMKGGTAVLAGKMISQSDNTAADTLYAKVGRDTLLSAIEKHYHLKPFGHRPTTANRWGTTRITAVGMVRFYAAVRHDPKVWPWLAKAMHAWAPRSSAGEPNDWGLAKVAPRSAVKNGWNFNADASRPGQAVINTTGFLTGDRYAIAILGEGRGSLYYAAGERIVTSEAYRLVHKGILPPKPKPVTTVVLDPGHNGGDGSHYSEISRLVNAGYGRTKPCNTTGTATNAGYPEHAFTWAVANQVKQMLAAHRIRVIMTRHSDDGVGPCVDERAAIESTAGVAAAVAIHADGSAAGNHGFHLCVDSRRPVGATTGTVARTKRLNAALHSALAKYSGIAVGNYVGTNGYYYRDDLAGLNLSRKPTAFLEIGNMRNAADAAKQTSRAGRTKIARAVALGILAYLAYLS